ncbi:hypothetical protein [Halopelagius longus]|uniref:Uncharacterized protein n=1 Tax=Halopelagius longus TaxID=1236180 RepID=A0A370INK8_9EURY|nr:hypothetical protein [Halopelagius longus]RDI72310.1 hypothetical protein DWB78_11635 [Halopelagius longus]
MLKTIAAGVGGAALPVGTVAGSNGERTTGSSWHTLTLSANGPVEYTLTVDGTLEPDTEGGDFSADSDEDVYRPTRDAYFGVRDETGPVPENAGGTTYLGDRMLITGRLSTLEVEPEDGYDANVYLDESLTSVSDIMNDGEGPYLDGYHSLMITANGPTRYEVLTIAERGEIQTESGDFSADSDDGTTTNDDGTVTATDETGPIPENAGGTTYLGDRYLLSGTVEELDLDYEPMRYDLNVYIDEQDVDPDVVRNNEF